MITHYSQTLHHSLTLIPNYSLTLKHSLTLSPNLGRDPGRLHPPPGTPYSVPKPEAHDLNPTTLTLRPAPLREFAT